MESCLKNFSTIDHAVKQHRGKLKVVGFRKMLNRITFRGRVRRNGRNNKAQLPGPKTK